ncbi:fimbrial protein [Serratia liquefaciens]|nr:fimbrial protein [Serratia liquefaciens]QNQ55467.1 fimbrial protein [Serratia liquefaciens]
MALSKMFLTGTAAVDGSYSIPLTARYYKTDAIMTAGKADATATFTLTYQ